MPAEKFERSNNFLSTKHVAMTHSMSVIRFNRSDTVPSDANAPNIFTAYETQRLIASAGVARANHGSTGHDKRDSDNTNCSLPCGRMSTAKTTVREIGIADCLGCLVRACT